MRGIINCRATQILHGEMSELAEGARLEIVYAPKGYLGFESPSLRHLAFVALHLNAFS